MPERELKIELSDADTSFLDGISKTIEERLQLSDELERIVDEVPLAENPIKMVRNFSIYFDESDGYQREVFIVDLRRRLNRSDTSEIQKGAISYFLDSIDCDVASIDEDSDSSEYA